MTNEHVPPNFVQPEAIQDFLDSHTRLLEQRSNQPVADEPPDFEAEMRKEGEARGYPISAERVGDVLRRCGRGEELDRTIAEGKRARAEHAARKLDKDAEHSRNLEGATGLRRAILEMHAPEMDYPSDATCKGCYVDEGCGCEGAHFPCSTYALARDWTGS